MLPEYKRVFVSIADLLGWLDWADDAAVESAIGRPRHTVRSITKRLFDLVVSVSSLLLFLPMLVIVSIVIKLMSPGPILLKLQRIGLGGRPFSLLKFRTRYIDESRFTEVGRLLHFLQFDELPQLLNVIQGKMSLVGPRALPTNASQTYQKPKQALADWILRRNQLKPGITGLWQIADRADFRDVVLYDLYYLDNVSIWLDIYILAKKVALALSNPRKAATDDEFVETVGVLLTSQKILWQLRRVIMHKIVSFAYEPRAGWRLEAIEH